MGLFHAVTSYCGAISVAVTACREMLPDPAFYKECLQSSFDDLYAAAVAPRKEKKRTKSAPSETQTRVVDVPPAPAAHDDALEDDLTLIKGVGRKLAERLRSAGLKRFKDIAALTKAELEAIDEELQLRGRILRDGWVAQAAALEADQSAIEPTHADVSASVH